jgi:hypothetical protein
MLSSFARAAVPVDRVVSFADPGRPIDPIKLSLHVGHLVGLLVQAEQKVFENAAYVPGYIAIESIRYVDPQYLNAVYELGRIWRLLSSWGVSRFAVIPFSWWLLVGTSS